MSHHRTPNAARIDTRAGTVEPLPERVIYSRHGIPIPPPRWHHVTATSFADTVPAMGPDEVRGRWVEVLPDEFDTPRRRFAEAAAVVAVVAVLALAIASGVSLL